MEIINQYIRGLMISHAAKGRQAFYEERGGKEQLYFDIRSNMKLDTVG
jgi:hypothetical protein